MADYGAALVNRALEGVALAALVGDQIDWKVRPAVRDLPGIVFQTVTDDRADHYRGEQGLRMTRVQADCFSAISSAEANLVANTLIARLRPEPGEDGADQSGSYVQDGIRFDRMGIEGPVDSGEQLETVYVHRARVDLLVWHAEIEEVI